jgi:hypothetical protein
MTNPDFIPSAVSTTADLVLQKARNFSNAGIWPATPPLAVERWLANFSREERAIGVHLLNGFVFLNRSLTDALFQAAFRALYFKLQDSDQPLQENAYRWKVFCSRVIITRVTGEEPNDTDSGFAFARRARQLLGVPQQRIVSPEVGITLALSRDPPPIVFVDDFVGSGQQMIKTWHRRYLCPGAGTLSFADIPSSGSVFYTPIITTAYGKSEIETQCPGLTMAPAHIIGSQYSALSRNSYFWPAPLRDEAIELVEKISYRHEIPNWRGFHDLALGLAFEHSVPDANLALFTWRGPNWVPLVSIR